MRFASPLIRGTLVRRYKRFLADVSLEDGREVTAHCANPGAMLGLNAPGTTVWLEPTGDPRRKLGFAWRLVELEAGHFVGIDTTLPNRLVAEALARGAHPGRSAGYADGPAGGALRHRQPDRLPPLRPGSARRLGGGEERASPPDGHAGRVPRQRHGARRQASPRAGAGGGGRAAGGDALRGAADRLRALRGSPPTSIRPMPPPTPPPVPPGSRSWRTQRPSTARASASRRRSRSSPEQPRLTGIWSVRSACATRAPSVCRIECQGSSVNAGAAKGPSHSAAGRMTPGRWRHPLKRRDLRGRPRR